MNPFHTPAHEKVDDLILCFEESNGLEFVSIEKRKRLIQLLQDPTVEDCLTGDTMLSKEK